MALLYKLPNRPEISVAVPDAPGVVMALQDGADAALRRAHGLPEKATLLHVVEEHAGLARGRLFPLARISTGVYTREDYLAQFEEAWERVEYGAHADEVVRLNHAAFQAPGPLLAALDAALSALADPALARAVLPEGEGREALAILRSKVAEAMALGATEVCLEADVED